MINPLSLEDRTILVTGASSGIGRETALVLSKLGAKVVLIARSLERLNETADQMEGTRHTTFAMDLTRVIDINSWVKEVIHQVGPLSGLVHCAGIHRLTPIRGVTQELVGELMDINLVVGLNLTRAIRQRGVYIPGKTSIVFVSSVMALLGQPGATIYSATKGALLAASKSLAMELANQGIRVNCVVPGQVNTPMTYRQQEILSLDQFQQIENMHPLGLGEPLDVAYACAYLLSDMARWITGTALTVDGGYSAH